MNEASGLKRDESHWRKMYAELKKADDIPSVSPDTYTYFDELEKTKVRIRDHRNALARQIRNEARAEELLEIVRNTVIPLPEIDFEPKPTTTEHKCLYALVSDLHYGISFKSVAGSYDKEIARERMAKYAAEIIRIGKDVDTLYISLMGDMISGGIHPSIRVEERENVVQQVIGAAELISKFIYTLSQHFFSVIVNSVDGNHSRIERNVEDSVRNEKLDILIPWFCKARLAEQKNVKFVDSELDSTIANFNIYGKEYVVVHGDYDLDLQKSSVSLSKLIGKKVDYFLCGHMHVPEARIEETGYIRNGSVCGSGDDYTMKKRLFGVPAQVLLQCSEQGVEAIYPIVLR